MSRGERETKPRETTATRTPAAGTGLTGLTFRRLYTDGVTSPFDAIEWELRTAAITNEKGEVFFEQKDVEVPKSWSMTATNIVAQKYFHGRAGTPQRERSVRQLVSRVADAITGWGWKKGTFRTAADRDVFFDELTHILVQQIASFNSPVWFNVGVEPKPQASACFINAVGDSMSSILDLAKTEGMLFKFGSGTGSNLSSLRSSTESLSSGGIASGPVSFMKGFDSFAGAIKSGGKTRRAAKMVILNVDHPDIEEFISCKAKEERKAWDLIEAGWDGSFGGEVYSNVSFQNANHSVRVTDAFMEAVETGGAHTTHAVTTGEPLGTYDARSLFEKMAEAAWICGDPGIQYDTTINRWNPCKATHRINASNPCSEYMFVDDSACNLASLNLLKFAREDGGFEIETFRHAVDIVFAAQEILVDEASYPTAAIEKNSHDFRPIGLGYANLGALLMYNGLPYDSDEGRHYAAAVTSLMHGQAYLTSSKLGAELGPFAHYAPNRDAFLEVIGMHRDAAYAVPRSGVPKDLLEAQRAVWDLTQESGRQHGFRNAQATVLAPTGTIGFMMDCDTTGVEPDLALVKYKKLVGGGTIKIVNNTVPHALLRLGYDEAATNAIVNWIDEKGTIEGAPGLKGEHLPVFDCAFKAVGGTRSIAPMGHVRMMAAVQPFLSGAISKTVNLPPDASVEEIENVYREGWKLGLKAIAVYRDGCKRTQPLNTAASKSDDAVKGKRGTAAPAAAPAPAAAAPTTPRRRKLPDERRAITHKFSVAGHEGYVTVGLYEDGTPGEIFLTMAKEGSTISGLMDAFATAISLTLQYGVPLEALVEKFSHMRFEPAGYTKNPEIPIAKSLVDYIFRWLASKFLSADLKERAGVVAREAPAAPALGNDAGPRSAVLEPVPAEKAAAISAAVATVATAPKAETAEARPIGFAAPAGEPVRAPVTFQNSADAPSCHECGSIMVRCAACYKCMNCGATSGCS
ncbi:MAG TPA: vitamin B12-dependent ribonucleotide reductase [Thermoanaerobaculia bacterium]|nr:vitamin B12-dependent ribonucleotide reductase [Thermoanaerobaculia bacterium]